VSGRVLVTDAARGAAITIIRSLGAAGLDVIAADAEGRSPGFLSRYASGRLRYPCPKTNPEGTVETLLRTAGERGVDLLVPVGDEVTLLLSEERARFEGVCALALPDADAYVTTQDKVATLSLAREHGVPVPRTVLVSTVEEALDAAESLGWPLVVTPRSSSARLAGRVLEHFEVSYAEDGASLIAEVGRLEGRSEVLLQEYCKGQGQGVELLLHRGRPLAAFQHRRLHEVPITGGASSFREGVALDPTLYDYSTRLLDALAWTGLAMVEFKITDGGPRLMEINGRVWGSLPLAVKSGVDFPARMAELYLKGPPENGFHTQTRYELGVRSRNLDLEVHWIASTLRGNQGRRLVAVPSRVEAVRAALRLAYPRDGYDVLSRDDPRPGLAEIARIPAKLRRKVRL
jgi:predicted ATP-grasp superfamily ATP-dependent carboligase